MSADLSQVTPEQGALQKALPPGINLFDLPTFRPDPNPPARPGADDHLRIRSHGVRT